MGASQTLYATPFTVHRPAELCSNGEHCFWSCSHMLTIPCNSMRVHLINLYRSYWNMLSHISEAHLMSLDAATGSARSELVLEVVGPCTHEHPASPHQPCWLVEACKILLFHLPLHQVRCVDVLQYFTIKMQDGVVATSYTNGDKFYIDPMKLLPLDRFLPKPKGSSAGITKGKSKLFLFYS